MNVNTTSVSDVAVTSPRSTRKTPPPNISGNYFHPAFKKNNKGNLPDRTRTKRILWSGMELCSIYLWGSICFRSAFSKTAGASSPDIRNSRLSALSPSSPQTSGSPFLKNSSRLHGGVHAGGISLRINGRICCDTNRPCCITAKSRIPLLYGADCWQVTVISARISIRMISLCATGSGASSTTRVLGITALVRNSSRNRCGGVFFTVQPSCCQIAHTFTCSATRTGAGSTFFRSWSHGYATASNSESWSHWPGILFGLTYPMKLLSCSISIWENLKRLFYARYCRESKASDNEFWLSQPRKPTTELINYSTVQHVRLGSHCRNSICFDPSWRQSFFRRDQLSIALKSDIPSSFPVKMEF